MSAKNLLRISTACLILSVIAASLHAGEGEPPAKVKIVLVGDSTVATGGGLGHRFSSSSSARRNRPEPCQKRRQLQKFPRRRHLAKSPRSQARFHLHIQFGHNDIPGKGPERETDAKTTYPENMGRSSTKPAPSAPKPILVTSVPRRHFKEAKSVCDPRPLRRSR